jgi:hypothetical protein
MKSEELNLSDAISHLLDECRMVLTFVGGTTQRNALSVSCRTEAAIEDLTANRPKRNVRVGLAKTRVI